MNPAFLGDSYDLVKRFFCVEIQKLGYRISVDAMLTGHWANAEEQFYRLIGIAPRAPAPEGTCLSALFLDPDTGINTKGGPRHISLDRISREVMAYDLVLCFDQAFSRKADPAEVMAVKLIALRSHACHAMYYDSHARFLFASRRSEAIDGLHAHLTDLGLPSLRLVRSGAVPSNQSMCRVTSVSGTET